jgi:hypothetical protein
MRMSHFVSLAAAVGGLLGLALSVLGAVALGMVGVSAYAPLVVTGLAAGLGIGLLGGVWIGQDEEARRRERARRRRGDLPGRPPDDEGPHQPLFGPLAFGLTFVTMGTFVGLRAAQQLAANPAWQSLAGLAWLTLAIAGGAGGIIAGAIWQVVVARLRDASGD